MTVAIAAEPVQVATSSASGPAVSVTLRDAAGCLEPGNLLVGVHHARGGTPSLPEGWAEARAERQGSSTTRIFFKEVAAGEPATVSVPSTEPAEQTLTVLEIHADGDDVAWALDQTSSRWTGSGADLQELSTGVTDLTVSRPQVAVAAIALLGDPGSWDAGFTDGFTRRSAVASEGPDADRSAHAVATRVLTEHAEVRTEARWTHDRAAAALLATFRPAPAPAEPAVFARPAVPAADTVRVVARASGDEPITLVVSESEDLSAPLESAPETGDPSTDRLVKLSVSGLSPGTRYHWAIRGGGRTSTRRGRLVTAPAVPASFTFATSSCGGYRNNSSGLVQYPMSMHPVWEAIFDHEPEFFVHLGDIHYNDVNTTSEADHRSGHLDVFCSVKQGRLWRRVPMAHTWSDHDYCGEASHHGFTGRVAARAAYRRVSPQVLAWPSGDNPISYAFSWGPRARFLVPDCRSMRSDPAAVDDRSKTMLGAQGKAWLLDQLRTAEADPEVALVVLYLEVPWISTSTDQDDWALYDNERTEIGRFIERHVTKQVLGLAGDAHMNAFDDGRNNRWGGFPVLHGGSLARWGSVKGGPYSAGAFPNPLNEDGEMGQFALVSVTDDGGEMQVQVSGHRVTAWGDESVQFTESISVPPRASAHAG